MARLEDGWPLPREIGPIPTELIAVFVLATVLRVYRLSSESLWIDEQFMVRIATEYTLAEIILEVPLFEPHPPLYNVFMWGWVALGDATALWMRATSVVFSLATIPVLYLLARRLFDRPTAGLTILLFAISPFQIWHAQDARMYALLVLATVTSWYLLVRLRERATPWLFAGYLLTGAVLGYTHVYGLFILFAQALVVGWWLRRSPTPVALTVRRSIGLFTGVGVLISPWIAILATRVLVPDPEFDDPADWLVPPGSVDLFETVRIHLFGFTRIRAPYDLLPETPVLLSLVLAVPLLLVYAMYFIEGGRENKPAVSLLVVWILLPVLLPFVLSWLVQPMYELRYTIVVSPALLMALAVGIRTLERRHLQVLLAVAVVVTMAYPLPAYYSEPQKDQWKEAADLVGAEATDDDVILIVPGWTQSSFAYYYGDRPGTQQILFAGSPQSQYAEAIASGDRVYLVVSYLDDRPAVLETAERAADRPPDERHTFVKIEVYVWD